MYLAGLGLFVGLLFYFGLSFEAGSVWCWSAAIFCIYFCLQPCLLPLHDDTERTANGTQKHDDKTEVGEAVAPLLKNIDGFYLQVQSVPSTVERNSSLR